MNPDRALQQPGTEAGAVVPSDELLMSLCRMGLLQPDEPATFVPLTGGVSSDILRVSTRRERFCIKRALPRLKVAALWEAPISRNAAEAAWLREVGGWFPGSVPELLGEDAALGLLAMEFLPAADYPVWKAQLLAGQIDSRCAAAVGRLLVSIHQRSAGDAGIAARFANDATFEPIRLDPYLRATAARYSVLAASLHALADQTLATKLALVHGDVSPKNILVGPNGPVLLDAECACWGDPAFDLAFCLNHLLLKAAWAPQWRAAYLSAFDALAGSYLDGIGWEPRVAFEARAARLLPALALARIDGKSPVEYITDEPVRDWVRQRAVPLIEEPPQQLAAVRAAWAAAP